MDDNEKFSWSALEYEEKEKSHDWFWALGIIIVTSAIASVIFENYFFATLLILGGALLGFFATKKPEMVSFELSEKGLKIKDRIYPYGNIKSFWVQVDMASLENPSLETNIKPLLFIHTERVFMPVITIPIKTELAEDVHAIMTSQNVPEVEMREHPTEKIMEVLGF